MSISDAALIDLYWHTTGDDWAIPDEVMVKFGRAVIAATVKLTEAARRDLARLQAGEHVELRYGPYEQLRDAGYIEGTQDNYRLINAGKR